MSSETVNNVVVVGRDAALWLSACALQTALHRSGVSVTAVELPTHLQAADVYATLPALEGLHNLLGVDEAALLGATGGVFSLGQNFIGPLDASASYFHAYGSYGSLIDHKAFFPHWLRARSFGLQVALEDFSLTAAAAKHGRMLIPDPATEAYGRTDYGYHLPAIEYVQQLKRLAQRRGVAVHQASTIECMLDQLSGAIAAVALDGERRITGQLFVDASGSEAVLMGSALGVSKVSWRDYFPVDRVVVATGSAFASIPPYAEIRAHANGWVALHPTRSSTHVIHAYSSEFCDESAALDAAVAVSRLTLQSAATRVSAPGMRAQSWDRNCVAIGAAACTFDPVHCVDLQAIQMGIVHLLSLFPVHDQYEAERAEFNRVSRQGFERLRDFQSAHYLARGLRVSDELRHKIETFRARGEVPLYEHETFPLDSWFAQFIGHGVEPQTCDPIAECTPPETMKSEFRRILGFIKDKVLEQTTHDRYLQSVCVGSRS